MLRKFLITIGIFCSGLFYANFCLATDINLTGPANCNTEENFNCTPGTKPINGCAIPEQGCDISVEGVFKWKPIGGAVKYVLDIDKFTQAEDSIYPYKFCLNPEECEFSFLDLTCCTITYMDKYCWNVTAYNGEGNLIGSSDESCFITESPPPPEELEPVISGGGVKNPLNLDNLEEVLSFLLNVLFIIALAVAVIMIGWAAFLFATSGGDPQKIASARKAIIWAVVAVAVALLAKGAPGIIKGLTNMGSQ